MPPATTPRPAPETVRRRASSKASPFASSSRWRTNRWTAKSMPRPNTVTPKNVSMTVSLPVRSPTAPSAAPIESTSTAATDSRPAGRFSTIRNSSSTSARLIGVSRLIAPRVCSWSSAETAGRPENPAATPVPSSARSTAASSSKYALSPTSSSNGPSAILTSTSRAPGVRAASASLPSARAEAAKPAVFARSSGRSASRAQRSNRARSTSHGACSRSQSTGSGRRAATTDGSACAARIVRSTASSSRASSPSSSTSTRPPSS